MTFIKRICYLSIIYIFISNTVFASKTIETQNNVITVLSIDGGGIRGIIPAKVLHHIEKETDMSISQSFDVITGTSTGSIIALALNVPKSNTKTQPKYSAEKLIGFYKEHGQRIFNKSWWHYIKTFGGWLGPKYSSDNLDTVLDKYFGNTKLGEALTEVVIPAFDINRNKLRFFTRKKGFNNPDDFLMKDLARSASAAPTYFPSVNLTNTKQSLTLVDAGISVNNPVLIGYINAINNFKHLDKKQIVVVSIGTGVSSEFVDAKKLSNAGLVGWAKPISSIMMDADARLFDQQMHLISRSCIGNNTSNTHVDYIRLQINIPKECMEMDHVSSSNIKLLEDLADNLIANHKKDLDYIVDIIKKHKKS